MAQKQKIIGLLSLIFLLVFLLAASLPQLQLEAGKVFTVVSDADSSAVVKPPDFAGLLFRLLQGLLVLFVILLIAHILVSLFDKKLRRRLFWDILVISALFLLVSWLSDNNRFETPIEETGTPVAEIVQEEEEFESAPSVPLEPFVADPPPWMLGLTIVGVAGVVAAAAFFAYYIYSKRGGSEDDSLLKVGDRAEEALDEIEKAEISFSDVIIRCYYDMSQAVMAAKGIQRDQNMTTNEFGEVLLARGLPGRPVRDLTGLFEQVRYGRRQLAPEDRQVAVDSLTEIVRFCRGEA